MSSDMMNKTLGLLAVWARTTMGKDTAAAAAAAWRRKDRRVTLLIFLSAGTIITRYTYLRNEHFRVPRSDQADRADLQFGLQILLLPGKRKALSQRAHVADER